MSLCRKRAKWNHRDAPAAGKSAGASADLPLSASVQDVTDGATGADPNGAALLLERVFQEVSSTSRLVRGCCVGSSAVRGLQLGDAEPPISLPIANRHAKYLAGLGLGWKAIAWSLIWLKQRFFFFFFNGDLRRSRVRWQRNGYSPCWGQCPYPCFLDLGWGSVTEAAHDAGREDRERISLLPGYILYLKALDNCGACKSWQTNSLISLGNDA